MPVLRLERRGDAPVDGALERAEVLVADAERDDDEEREHERGVRGDVPEREDDAGVDDLRVPGGKDEVCYLAETDGAGRRVAVLTRSCSWRISRPCPYRHARYGHRGPCHRAPCHRGSLQGVERENEEIRDGQ